MSYPKLLQQVILGTSIVILLAGCVTPAVTPVSKPLEAIVTPKPPTPTAVSTISTPVSPTAIPLPSPSIPPTLTLQPATDIWQLTIHDIGVHQETSVLSGPCGPDSCMLVRGTLNVSERRSILEVQATIKNMGVEPATFMPKDVVLLDNGNITSTLVGLGDIGGDIRAYLSEWEQALPIEIEPEKENNVRLLFVVSKDASEFIVNFLDLPPVSFTLSTSTPVPPTATSLVSDEPAVVNRQPRPGVILTGNMDPSTTDSEGIASSGTISLTVSEDGVSLVLVDIALIGLKCPGVSAGSLRQKFDGPFPIKEDSIVVSLPEGVEITGEFTSPTEASGMINLTLEMPLAGPCKFGVWHWEAQAK